MYYFLVLSLLLIVLDGYIIWKIRFIKRNGNKIIGEIVKVKKRSNGNDDIVYVSKVGYTNSIGEYGTTKTYFDSKTRVGEKIELYEYEYKGKLRVVHIIKLMYSLNSSIILTVFSYIAFIISI
jgi:hypothetical protein